MCGIVGVIGRGPVNQLLYDSLLLLQHRGQDAAGIATSQGNQFNMYKAHGLVRDVFRTRNMRALPGTSGVGQVRYPTAGSSASEEEAQPFYVNAPFGIMFAHNGNLTNWRELRESLYRVDRRHINTNSDSEVLLNVLAHELQSAASGVSLDDDAMFRAVAAVHSACAAPTPWWRRFPATACWPSAIRMASARCASAARKRKRASSGWWRPSRWRWKAAALPSCAMWRRARRSSSTWTAVSSAASAPTIRSWCPAFSNTSTSPGRTR